MLFPEFSAFKIKGPLKITIFPFGKDDNISMRSSIDLTNADLYVPVLALKKVKGKNGQLKLDFTN